LPLDPVPENPDALLLAACGFYEVLTHGGTDSVADDAATDASLDLNLGGNLFYAGELDANGRAMVIAANVAGCATLAATDDAAAQKQAVRDGVVDFLVSTLDEALRILKNEIRKHAPVAVCVGAPPPMVEREKLERGVLPELVGMTNGPRAVPEFGPGSRRVVMRAPDRSRAFINWQVIQAPARWMAKLDGIAMDCVEADAWARRWIRLSSRYCGRGLLAHRGLYCSHNAATQIASRFAAAVESGQVEAEVLLRMKIDGAIRESRFSPAARA
jgi:urocanate hydratase